MRSYVIREGRFTASQKKALKELWPRFGISTSNSVIDFNAHFEKTQAIVLDVGFGSGDSLISLAQQRPDINFIGVEVYRPGIGNLFRRLGELNLCNVRVINKDVLDVFQANMVSDCLLGIVVWFPDPWPKKRHHKRRLIQADFLKQAARVLQSGGMLHLASDWKPYAEEMLAELARIKEFVPVDSEANPLKLKRPQTRFEQRGLSRGHAVTDLVYQIEK